MWLSGIRHVFLSSDALSRNEEADGCYRQVQPCLHAPMRRKWHFDMRIHFFSLFDIPPLNQKTTREPLGWFDNVLDSVLPSTTLYSAITISDHTHIGPVHLHVINPAPSLNYQSMYIPRSSCSKDWDWELHDSVMASWYRLLFARCSLRSCSIFNFYFAILLVM